MGEPDLNETVYEYIQKDDFATARFDLSTVTIPENTPLEFGTAKQFFGAGTFTMKGVEIPLDVQAEITPTVNDEGLPRLNVTAQFSIRLLEPFEIEGPPGPDPANDTLEFFLTFPMKPVE